MHYQPYTDIKAFYRDTRSVLMRSEAQNLIMLGNTTLGNEGVNTSGWRDPASWFMATVSDDTGVRLTVLMTPPYNLTLYETDNQPCDAALKRLAEELSAAGASVPGVMAENGLAMRFARVWADAMATDYHVGQNQRIYALTNVNPEIPSVGSLRLAQESDLSFLPYWLESFTSDCFGSPFAVQGGAEDYRNFLRTDRLYILEDHGTPVSMAKSFRELQTVCGVSYVYTPPYFRGRGYATACVAGVSRAILQRGFTQCVLYTDLANPVSNSIYQKIGYRPVCDSLVLRFA